MAYVEKKKKQSFLLNQLENCKISTPAWSYFWKGMSKLENIKFILQ